MFRKKYPTPPSDPSLAYERALRSAMNILGYKDNSTSMLTKKLKERGYTDETVSEVVAALSKNGFLNEKRMLTNEVRRLSEGRYFGRRRVVSELFRLGYSREDIGEIDFDEIDFDGICYSLLEKLGGKNDVKTKNRLISKGHSSQSVSAAYARHSEEHGEEEDE